MEEEEEEEVEEPATPRANVREGEEEGMQTPEVEGGSSSYEEESGDSGKCVCEIFFF
jgi:hypothetical protein